MIEHLTYKQSTVDLTTNSHIVRNCILIAYCVGKNKTFNIRLHFTHSCPVIILMRFYMAFKQVFRKSLYFYFYLYLTCTLAFLQGMYFKNEDFKKYR